MEPSWKDLTSTPTGALLTVASDINGELSGSVHSAHGMLSLLADATRALRAGTIPAELRDFGDDVVLALDAREPSAVLTGAIMELLRLSGLHTRAHPFTEAWKEHRRHAVDHTRDAMKKLQSAASMARKFEIALRRVPQMTVAPVLFSPTWTAWTSLVLCLANDAVVTTELALHALRRMRDAVVLELQEVSRIANRNR
ncbi:hypothetical protein BS78_07G100400 [Paspalum vaginatum]|nr:hypothetical protein BS78_07G100400 [Paspalum vaginatum]